MSEDSEGEDRSLILPCVRCRKKICISVDCMDDLYERKMPLFCNKCYRIMHGYWKDLGEAREIEG